MTTNPLLNFDELPRFSEIGAEHIELSVLCLMKTSNESWG